MDSNHDKGLQRALCYHYTIGQAAVKYSSGSWTAKQKAASSCFRTLNERLARRNAGCIRQLTVRHFARLDKSSGPVIASSTPFASALVCSDRGDGDVPAPGERR